MRINKFLAKCGLGSRRKVEKYIIDGDIRVNDEICTKLSTQINPDKDRVEYKHKVLQLNREKIYLMMNKPKNYLVSTRDDFGRRLVYELLPDLDVRLFAVGRLDYRSEGLLLFTSDGKFANQIIHPRYKLPKVYKVKVKGKITNSDLDKLRRGIALNGKKTLPAKVFLNESYRKRQVLKMTIYEGRKRQIRRMIEAVGATVTELKRLQIGHVKLGKLPPGMWRMLYPNEVEELRYQIKKGR